MEVRTSADLLEAASKLREEALEGVAKSAVVVEEAKFSLKSAQAGLKNAMRACVELGVEKEVIAVAAGVSPQTVSTWTRKEEEPKRKRGKKPTEEPALPLEG